MKCSSSLNVLGLTIDSRLTWKEHIHGIAAVASQKLGFLFAVRSYSSSTLLLALYKSLVRPHLEYCSHIWAGAAECHLELLNKIQRRATRLVGNANLTFQLAPLNAHRRVGFLFLFYRFYHGHCANSIAELMPRPAEIGRPLRNREAWHPYRVDLCRSRTVTSQSRFIARTSQEWNLLSCSVFLPEYDLQSFKSKINKDIMTDIRNLDRTRPDQ